MKYLIIIALILLILWFVFKFLSRFKFPKTTAISVFTGGVKTGKSAVSLAHALSMYRKAIRSWKFTCFLINFFNFFRSKKKQIALPEKPLFYSSIKLRNIDYVPLTQELLLRKKRFAFKSVVFIDEASLVADSQLIKDIDINLDLLLFFKLFGHETHGGKCVFNSHCITDLHYALKRTTSQYFYIHHTSRWIPFFSICKMREERFSEDGSNVNTFNEDVEDSLKTVFFRKSVFKKYDCFCFSELTDDLAVVNGVKRLGNSDSLKMSNIVSFRPEFANLGKSIKEKEENEKKKC